jgi:hypothetical protein
VSSFARLICAAGLAATIALLATASGGSAAASLRSCPLSVTKSESLGATYVTKLRAHGVRCSGAAAVAKAFNRCRKEKGPGGRCTHRVKTYGCTEARPAAEQIPTQANGHVTCSSGSRRVRFDYQQNR